MLLNPSVPRGSSFGDDIRVRRGCFCWLIHASPVVPVSLMIYESLGAVWAVEAMRHPWQHFR